MNSIFGSVNERLRYYRLLACGIEPRDYGPLVTSVRESIDMIVERSKARREIFKRADIGTIQTVRYYGSGGGTMATSDSPPIESTLGEPAND